MGVSLMATLAATAVGALLGFATTGRSWLSRGLAAVVDLFAVVPAIVTLMVLVFGLGAGAATMALVAVVSVTENPAQTYTRELLAASRLDRPAGPARAVTSPDLALRVRDLRVETPDGKLAANGLSFAVQAGEGVALLGPSGAGKTTLVRVLLGQRAPEAGTVELGFSDGSARVLASAFEGRSLSDRLAVQLVPQDPVTSLNPVLTVKTQLMRACARRHPHWSRRQRGKRVEELLSLVGLDPSVLGRRPGRLSGGQAQRVAIARALAHEPRVLVLDESTSALDATTQRDVLAMLAEVRAQSKAAFVVVTHDPRVASCLCDQQVRLGASEKPGE